MILNTIIGSLFLLNREHTIIDYKAKLREKGKSLRSWALAKGYPVRTVAVVVQRWGNRTDLVPHGGISRQIMAELRRELDEGGNGK